MPPNPNANPNATSGITAPQEQALFNLAQRVGQIEQLLREFKRIDRFYFDRNIEIPTNIGIKVGTSSTQKIAFWGATPVDRPATVADPTGGVNIDTEARAAINALIDRLQELGLIA